MTPGYVESIHLQVTWSCGIDFGRWSVTRAGLLSLTFLAVLSSAEAPATGYAVVLDGNVLFRIEAPRVPYSAAQRATDISNDLLALARSTEVDASSLRMVPGETDTILLAGHTFVISITDEDARRAGRRRDDLAVERRHTIQEAIATYRRARAPGLILRAFLVAIVCWAAAAAFIFVMYRLKRRAVLLLGERYHRFLASRHLDSVHARFGGQLLAITDAVANLLAAITALVAICLASYYSLSRFPGMAGISRSIFDWLQEPVLLAVKLFVRYLPHLFVVLLIAGGTYVLIRILRVTAKAVEDGDISFPGFYPEWAKPTSKLLTFVFAILALVVMFPYLPGGDSPAFRGISIFIGVLVSLGSSSAMGNLIAGIILTYMHPYRVGDRVRISDTVGDVQEKSLLVTRLRTVKNVEIILPNSMILGAHILNYTVQAEARGLILHTSVTVGYNAPWRTVHQLLIRAAEGTDGVLTTPEPFVLQISLGDSTISYEINAFTNLPSEMERIVARMHERIQDEFNRAGVELLSPAYVSLRDGNTVTIAKQNRTEGTQEPWFTLPRT